MKYLAALALLAGSAAAFAPTALVSRTSALSMVPPNGKPASSHEEDLDKTFKVCRSAVSETSGHKRCMLCCVWNWQMFEATPKPVFVIANICPIFLGFSRIFVSLFNAHQVIMDFNSDGDEAPAEEAPEAAPKKKKGKKQPQHEG